MRSRLWIFGVLLLTVMVSSSTFAQHVADPAALRSAVNAAENVDRANRAVVLRALEREDVRLLADRIGVDMQNATSAVQALSGSELAELADPARTLVLDQSGGASTVVISTTTLLLVLIIVVLLAA
jgi:hypothetical protein